MTSRYLPIGLDLRHGRVCAAQLVRGRSGLEVHRLSRLPIGAAEPDVAGLWELLDRRGFVGRRVCLAAPRQALRSSVAPVPVGAPEEAQRSLARAELAREHQWGMSEFEMECWRLPPTTGAKSDEDRVLAYGCEKQGVAALIEAFADSGVSVECLDLEALTLARALEPIVAGSGGKLRVVAELGWSRATVIVLFDGVVLYERVSSDCEYRELVESVGAPIGGIDSVAHRLLQGAAGSSGEGQSRASGRIRGQISGYLEPIAHELEVSIDYAERRHGGDDLEALLVGPGASLPGVGASMEEACGVRCRSVSPRELLAGDADLIDDPELVFALGLARWEEC